MPGTVVIERFSSPALAGNRLGDPAERDVPVYLPPGYAADPARRYPAIYWLHGFTGTGMSAVARSLWSESLPELMDRAITAGAPPGILVMADGSTRYGGGQYLNSAATGRYEDAIVQDLVGFIDGRYRTRRAPEHRGLDGKSSGGYGALVLGMRHPEVFGAVASHSGDMYFEACYRPFFWKALEELRKHGGIHGFLAAFDAMAKKSHAAVEAQVALVALAMAYSPNPDGSFELPVDAESGEIRPEVWSRWLAWDPVEMAAGHAAALKRMRLVYFECGLRDEWNLQYGARILHRRLEALGVPHEHAEFDDDHMGIHYRYVESLRRLLVALQ